MTPTITVYRGFPTTAAHVWSPFAIKLEARLRFAGLTYTIEQGSPRTGPRGKIPYISLNTSKDIVDAEFFSDTQLISDLLKENGIVPDLNEALSPAETAIDLALTALLEDKLYFYNAVERWNDNYYTMRDGIMASIPYPLRVVIGYIAWRQCNATLHGQGTGRFSADEINSFREKIWSSFDNLLADARHKTASGQKLFWALGGKEPSEADTALFGFIVAGLVCDASPVSAKLIRGLPNVLEYARRIHETYFPDYEAPKWD
ncbi:hypothetical protein UA08_03845 [Talaromyces atroroseus]|uniref:Thioredoxin-like fold domain-containing protein n=1 Tax=Talaromyces atroroseus TaxID=1441469 RepID=A0A225B0B5_TALAT|nr:hypothetical protein UA08_03845 [Talaromyces atroroseus]OKL61399.1 hypothetical protein UA08_03845 [Talaromyces atroroseus]